jgi:hypothetical protein
VIKRNENKLMAETKYFYRLDELDSEAKEVAWIEFKRKEKSKISLEDFLNDSENLTKFYRFDESGMITMTIPF